MAATRDGIPVRVWTGPAGTFRQATDPAKPQRDLYTALSIEPPKKILALDPAPTAP